MTTGKNWLCVDILDNSIQYDMSFESTRHHNDKSQLPGFISTSPPFSWIYKMNATQIRYC